MYGDTITYDVGMNQLFVLLNDHSDPGEEFFRFYKVEICGVNITHKFDTLKNYHEEDINDELESVFKKWGDK